MPRFGLGFVLFFSLVSVAQSVPSSPPPEPAVDRERGRIIYADFSGSSNDDGQVFVVGVSAGYQFNRRLSVIARLPFYFAITPTSTTITTTTTPGFMSGSTSATSISGKSTNTGLGNPAVSVQLNFPNRVLDYQPSVTTWIPVTGTSSGFSTGRFLIDWTNRFSRRFGRAVPFGNISLSNTVPNTRSFIRPFTALGVNTSLEGGTNVRLTKKVFSAGGSLYTVLPSGQQRVYSRMLPASESGGTAGGAANNMMSNNVFMLRKVTTGTDLTRDHGFSTWLDAFPSRYLIMEVGYTRSAGYKLNTVSFSVGLNLGAWTHREIR